MPKITLPGFIHVAPEDDFVGETKYCFWPWEDMSRNGYVLVGPYTIELEMPEGFDPTAGRVAALEKKRDELTKEFRKSVAEINEQISRLQCLEFTPSAHEAFSDDGKGDWP